MTEKGTKHADIVVVCFNFLHLCIKYLSKNQVTSEEKLKHPDLVIGSTNQHVVRKFEKFILSKFLKAYTYKFFAICVENLYIADTAETRKLTNRLDRGRMCA